MVSLAQLWMPILASAVTVFIASSVIWMALPIHKKDYKSCGEHEDRLMDFIKSAGFSPGVYFMPWCQHGGKPDPATQEKQKNGPWASLFVLPKPNMGKMLAMWFVHILLVEVFVAYITSHAGLISGSDYLKVFRVAGATSFLAFAGYSIPLCVWHGMPWSQLPGRVFDGLVYTGLTAGMFGWLWPHATVG